MVLSSWDPSSTKEGNTGFFLQITEGSRVALRTEAPLFTPILRQLSPELTSVLRAGTFLKQCHIIKQLGTKQQMTLQTVLFFVNTKSYLLNNYTVTNHKAEMESSSADLKLKDFHKLNNIKSEADGRMP